MKTIWMAAAATGALCLAGCMSDMGGDGMASSATSAGIPAAANAAVNVRDYVTEAARGDLYEVQAGQLAASRASIGPVRDFGAMMVRDHTATTQMIKAALASANLGTPAAPSLDARRQGMLQQLQAAGSGTAFDRAYVQQQVMAHQEALALHQAYAKGGDNPALRGVAAQIAPKVQEHLAMVQRMANGQGAAGG